jgi:hypothetical protein
LAKNREARYQRSVQVILAIVSVFAVADVLSYVNTVFPRLLTMRYGRLAEIIVAVVVTVVVALLVRLLNSRTSPIGRGNRRVRNMPHNTGLPHDK